MKNVIVVLFASAILSTGCCSQIKEDADALVHRHEKCSAGDTCVIVHFYEAAGANNCLGAFQCSGALNAEGLSEFRKEARELVEDFKSCNECTMADCMDVNETNTEAFCNEETGRCELTFLEGY